MRQWAKDIFVTEILEAVMEQQCHLYVCYNVLEGQKGITHLAPENCQPDYPDQIQIHSVHWHFHDGVSIEWPQDLIDYMHSDLEEYILAELEDDDD